VRDRAKGQSNDDAEFEAFVAARSLALHRTAYLLTGDVHHAEDLLQSALERTYKAWARVQQAEQPEAYVRRIMVNLATDRWRRRRYVVEQQLLDDAAWSTPDRTGDVELRDLLLRGLRELPAGMRAVVVLRYWEGLSEAETAAIMGCSTGSVKAQASRGLARLRGLVETPESNSSVLPAGRVS
jgi:RNA polymerase sigma-70 factor (sigma-E family)